MDARIDRNVGVDVERRIFEQEIQRQRENQASGPGPTMSVTPTATATSASGDPSTESTPGGKPFVYSPPDWRWYKPWTWPGAISYWRNNRFRSGSSSPGPAVSVTTTMPSTPTPTPSPGATETKTEDKPFVYSPPESGSWWARFNYWRRNRYKCPRK
jgi:hypothetical protein